MGSGQKPPHVLVVEVDVKFKSPDPDPDIPLFGYSACIAETGLR